MVTTSLHDPVTDQHLETARFALWPLPDLRLRREEPAATPPSGANGGGISELAAEYERGLTEGRAQARRELDGEMGRMLTALHSAHRALLDAQERFASESRGVVNTIAIAVARQIVQREIEADEGIVARLVQAALEEVAGDSNISVRVNPADLALCRSHIGAAGESGRIEWIEDTQLSRGSCVVESDNRIIDGRLDSVLADLHQRLSNA